MIRPDIQAGSSKWIAELRLQDRIIMVRYTKNLADPFGKPVYGLMTILNLDEGRFLIEVQDPETWPIGGSRELTEQSIEEVYVHELVHIRWIDLTAHNPDPAALVQEERATWATARALIRANSSTRAAMVRAMLAHKAPSKKVFQMAAMRRQTKGRAMDAAAVIAALKEADGEAALQILSEYVAEQLGGAAPPSGSGDGMGADAGNGDPQKDKPPMNMGDEKNVGAQYSRAMRANLDEIERGKRIVQTDAKRAIVRGMKADGLTLTPHAEKQIIEAKSIEEAQAFETFARSMSAAPVPGAEKKGAQPPADRNALAGLTLGQRQAHARYMRTNPDKAARFLEQCAKTNAARAGKGA